MHNVHILSRRSVKSHLDSVLDFPSVVSDDEGGLHDSRELDVAVSFMLTLELVQQGLIGSLGETRGNSDFIRQRFKIQVMRTLEKKKVESGINLTSHFMHIKPSCHRRFLSGKFSLGSCFCSSCLFILFYFGSGNS